MCIYIYFFSFCFLMDHLFKKKQIHKFKMSSGSAWPVVMSGSGEGGGEFQRKKRLGLPELRPILFSSRTHPPCHHHPGAT